MSRLASSAQLDLVWETPEYGPNALRKLASWRTCKQDSSSKLYCDVRRLMPQPTLRGFAAVTPQNINKHQLVVKSRFSGFHRVRRTSASPAWTLRRLGSARHLRACHVRALLLNPIAACSAFYRLMKRVLWGFGQGLDVGLPFSAGRPADPGRRTLAKPFLLFPKDNRCRRWAGSQASWATVPAFLQEGTRDLCQKSSSYSAGAIGTTFSASLPKPTPWENTMPNR